ncbi:MAG: lamin tail domain-containing protein [Candidatus Chaera renei]|uniref:Lamin tail domain-containing protein n=1 Tax=Candidatus Chaera renei TaxID=2506947 RepID=A0A4Q0AJS2_9BACT|nr:MAG: lamin tail domain-containing protein [Candidatus Chaera renei]
MIAPAWTATVIQMWAIFALAAAWAAFWPAEAFAANDSGTKAEPVPISRSLIIVEASPGFNSAAAKAEFVELTNVSDGPVSLTGWQLRKLPSTSAKGSLYLNLATAIDEAEAVIEPGQRLVLATESVSPADPRAFLYKSSISLGADKGTLRLVDPQGETADELSWDKPLESFKPCREAPPASGPDAAPHSSAKSFKRQLNADGQWVDSGRAEADFCLSQVPTSSLLPAVSDLPLPAEPPALPDEDPPGDGEPLEPGRGGNVVYAPLLLNELLPDPTAPQTDEDHEYVELFNPTADTVDIAGYSIVTGSNWRYKYQFAEGAKILPGGYAAVTSAVSGLRLVNDGSGVRLLDPAGKVIDETNYPAAKSGQSWSRGPGDWTWSLLPTPGLPNIIQVPAEPAPPAPVAVTAAKKTVKRAPAKKPASRPKASSRTAVAKAAQPPAAQPASIAAQPPNQQINWTVLGAVAGLVGAYGIFEYRREIAALGRKLLDKFTAGR